MQLRNAGNSALVSSRQGTEIATNLKDLYHTPRMSTYEYALDAQTPMPTREGLTSWRRKGRVHTRHSGVMRGEIRWLS